MQAGAPQQQPLMLPKAALQGLPASWGAFPAPSPTSKPLCTPMNVATSTWRTNVCPFAPERRTGRPAVSLDPSPTASSSEGGMVTPANFWPDQSPAGTPMSGAAGISTAASSLWDQFANVRQAWPASTAQRSGVPPLSFNGSQSPFSADVTPVAAAGSGTTRSRKSTADLEWLAPILDARTPVANSGASTPTGLGVQSVTSMDFPMRRTSTQSVGLNTALIYEGSPTSTPMSCMAAGEDSKKGATSSLGSGAFFLPMPDNGPATRLRELGA